MNSAAVQPFVASQRAADSVPSFVIVVLSTSVVIAVVILWLFIRRTGTHPTRVPALAYLTMIKRPRFARGHRLPNPLDASTFVTPRLTLRRYRLDDADDWFDLQSEESVNRFLSWPTRTREQSRLHLSARTRHRRLWQTDDFLALAIEKDDRVIGDISLQLRSIASEVRTVEIGWIIHPRYGSQGYATEAATAASALAFDRLDARLVIAVVHPDNERSLALARRLGFIEANRHDEEILLILTSDAFQHRQLASAAGGIVASPLESAEPHRRTATGMTERTFPGRRRLAGLVMTTLAATAIMVALTATPVVAGL